MSCTSVKFPASALCTRATAADVPRLAGGVAGSSTITRAVVVVLPLPSGAESCGTGPVFEGRLAGRGVLDDGGRSMTRAILGGGIGTPTVDPGGGGCEGLFWPRGAGGGGSDGGVDIGRKAKNTAIAPRPRAVMHVAGAQARTVRRLAAT
jgi:hypothetical protein